MDTQHCPATGTRRTYATGVCECECVCVCVCVCDTSLSHGHRTPHCYWPGEHPCSGVSVCVCVCVCVCVGHQPQSWTPNTALLLARGAPMLQVMLPWCYSGVDMVLQWCLTDLDTQPYTIVNTRRTHATGAHTHARTLTHTHTHKHTLTQVASATLARLSASLTSPPLAILRSPLLAAARLLAPYSIKDAPAAALPPPTNFSTSIPKVILTHSHSFNLAHTNTHTHTLSHAHTHTHTRKHTHTHTHTHAQELPPTTNFSRSITAAFSTTLLVQV
jgi:hypothetical protein